MLEKSCNFAAVKFMAVKNRIYEEVYDREHEMSQLKEVQRQAYDDCSRFVVLTGRRRVGKTSLVYKLMRETEAEAPGLYFFVGRKTK